MIALVRWLILAVGVVIVTWASVQANIWFYSSLAEGQAEKDIYAKLGLGADLFKIVGWSLAAELVRRFFWLGWIARVVWLGCMTASLIAAIGFASEVQAGLEDPRSSALRSHQLDNDQLAADESELGRLTEAGEPMAPGEAQAALDAILDSTPAGSPGPLRSVLRGSTGALCDGTWRGPLTTAHCPRIREAEADKSRADRFAELNAAIRDTRERMRNRVIPANATAEAPVFKVLGDITGAMPDEVKPWVLFGFAAIVEIVASLGFSFIQHTAPQMKLRIPRLDLQAINWWNEVRTAAGYPPPARQPAPVAAPPPVATPAPAPAAPAPSDPAPAPDDVSTGAFDPRAVDAPPVDETPPPAPPPVMGPGEFRPNPPRPARVRVGGRR